MVKLSILFVVISAFALQEPQPSVSPVRKFKPVLRLSCGPHIIQGNPQTPTTVWASLQIVHPDEKLWCSEIAWYTGNDFQGSEQSDCQPYDQVLASKEGEIENWSIDASRRFSFYVGKYRIKAKLKKLGKVVAEAECEVNVR